MKIDSGSSVASSPQTKKPPLGSPPSILHIMLWVSGCAVFMSFARQSAVELPGQVSTWMLLWLLNIFVGACWMGMTLVIARKLGWGQGDVELGAWLLFSLGIIQLASCGINQLPEHLRFSKNSLLMAAVCLAWSLPILSHRLTGEARWLLVALLVIDLVWRIPFAMSQLMPDWAWQDLEGKMRWAVRWPSVVIAVAVFYTIHQRRPFDRLHGWLHWLGLACLLLEDLLLVWL